MLTSILKTMQIEWASRLLNRNGSAPNMSIAERVQLLIRYHNGGIINYGTRKGC